MQLFPPAEQADPPHCNVLRSNAAVSRTPDVLHRCHLILLASSFNLKRLPSTSDREHTVMLSGETLPAFDKCHSLKNKLSLFICAALMARCHFNPFNQFKF